MNYADRILPGNLSSTPILDSLLDKKYQIPTFQRQVVWDRESVKKLWDSIYKFYPLGSILIWQTASKLQEHREIGGHKISDENFSRVEYQYILDGQQRTTFLLTSIYGGTIEGREGFNPTLYIDLTILTQDEADDEGYKKRFLFWDEIDDRNGELKQNIGRKRKYEAGLIVKLKDIKENFGKVEKKLVENPDKEFTDYDHPLEKI